MLNYLEIKYWYPTIEVIMSIVHVQFGKRTTFSFGGKIIGLDRAYQMYRKGANFVSGKPTGTSKTTTKTNGGFEGGDEDYDTTTYYVGGKVNRVVHKLDGDLSSETWYKNGVIHRDAGKGPARTNWADDDSKVEEWFKDGKLHRVGAPAEVTTDGWMFKGDKIQIAEEKWYDHGNLIRTIKYYKDIDGSRKVKTDKTVKFGTPRCPYGGKFIPGARKVKGKPGRESGKCSCGGTSCKKGGPPSPPPLVRTSLPYYER